MIEEELTARREDRVLQSRAPNVLKASYQPYLLKAVPAPNHGLGTETLTHSPLGTLI